MSVTGTATSSSSLSPKSQLRQGQKIGGDAPSAVSQGSGCWYMYPTAGEHTPQVKALKVSGSLSWAPLGSPVTVGMDGSHGLPALPSASISLPAQSITSRDGVKYFAIDVVPHDGSSPWRVFRRYQHFLQLAEWASKRIGTDLAVGGVPFPGKTWLPCSGSALEVRRRALEAWLDAFLQQARRGEAAAQRESAVGLAGEVPSTGRIGKIVQYDDDDHHFSYKLAFSDGLQPAEDWFARDSVSVSSCLEVAIRLFLLKGRTAIPPLFIDRHSMTVAASPNGAPELLCLELPGDVGPGDLVQVTVPDGTKVTIMVPWRTSSSGALALWYYASGCLAVDSRQ